MNATSTGLKTATPVDMVNAWNQGVMYSNRTYAEREMSDHPFPKGLIDPTFHRDEHKRDGGWHTAREITNNSAIFTMRTWLSAHGLAAPLAVEAAWEATIARNRLSATVQEATAYALEEAYGNEQVVDLDDFFSRVIESLEDAREQHRS